MQPRSTTRTLIAAALVSVVTLVPATARAGACTFQISPSPGWRGAEVTISGYSMGANVNYYVNFSGSQIHSGTTNSNGAFSFQYTIPNSTPVGTVNWFVGSDGCGMDDSRSYTVLAAAPTTTSATTIPPPTTTLAPSTTAAATTTTAAATTTTVADLTTTTAGGVETTTTVGDATTTTVGDEGEEGESSPVVLYVIIGAVAAVVLFLLGRTMGSRRR